jgi:hypothetical protein
LKFIALVLISAAALSACHRQQALRIAYVPTPPPAPSATTGQSGVMVISKPAPAQPVASAPKAQQHPPERLEQSATQPQPQVTRKEITAAPAATTSTPPAGDAPQLEPAHSLQQQVALETQIKSLQQNLRQRMASLVRRALSSVDQKTLADAQILLVQSGDAMKTGDFLQSLNLARKADLLVGAVEKQQ